MTTIIQALAELESSGKPAALCTVVRTSGSTPRHSTSKMLVHPDGRILGTVGGGELEERVRKEALASLSDGKPRLLAYEMTDPARGDPGLCGGQVEVFVEPILPSPVLVVVGGGHVGKAVAHLAKWLGFRVAVSDDRPEFCTPDANPDADEFYPVPLAELPKKLSITPQTYLVLTTRGSSVDVDGLPALLETNAGYIGVIGSRRRWATTVEKLNAAGLTDQELGRVRSPMGLGLGAETPEEIAVSILAEILMLRGEGSGKPMKEPK
ncbi:MAG TPA: XdhC family protein [Anaerolineales bacterium]|nr:XdhC family protein [Anaerolineales bacterium]